MIRCKATITFGDNFGDNDATFHCELKSGHTKSHLVSGNQDGRIFEICWSDTRTWREKLQDWWSDYRPLFRFAMWVHQKSEGRIWLGWLM